MRRLLAVFGILGILLAVQGAAWGCPVPTFTYLFDRPAYAVAPGGTIDVHVYLQEDTNGGSSILAGSGLLSAGVMVDYSLTPGDPLPTRLTSPGDIFGNTAEFQTILTSLPSDHQGLLEETAGADPAQGYHVSGDIYRLYLGTFRFTGGTHLGELTLLTALDDPGSSGTRTTNSPWLDPSIDQANATITVTPEPAALLQWGILGALGAGTTLWLRRRRGA